MNLKHPDEIIEIDFTEQPEAKADEAEGDKELTPKSAIKLPDNTMNAVTEVKVRRRAHG